MNNINIGDLLQIIGEKDVQLRIAMKTIEELRKQLAEAGKKTEG